MNKTLLICFVVVSVVSLAVSSAAVLTTARVYHQNLYSEPANDTLGDTSNDTTHHSPDTNQATVGGDATFSPEVSDTAAPPSETEVTTDADADTEASVIPDTGVLLRLASGKLSVTDSSGSVLFERTVNPDTISSNDIGALIEGISFPNAESAISAIYDLVS